MIDLNSSTLIYRPIRQVFDFMSVPENNFQWQYGTLASARISEGAGNIGTFFRSIGHLMGPQDPKYLRDKRIRAEQEIWFQVSLRPVKFTNLLYLRNSQ